MAKKFGQALLCIAGLIVGPLVVATVNSLVRESSYLLNNGIYCMEIALKAWAVVVIYISSAIITFVLTIIFSKRITEGFVKVIRAAEARLAAMALADILLGVLGLIFGLLIALLLSTLTATLPFRWLTIFINVLLYIFLGWLGWRVMLLRRGDIELPRMFRRHRGQGAAQGDAKPKVMDTSVIIDGRIFDICRTGILEGTIVVPNFVLQELRHIADSGDGLKRARGRRGLDILNKMQKELEQPVVIEDKDYDDISEVDAKLLKLADELGGVVVTNDYNLNKVASVQSVPVFNINELANAIKPVLLPGEEMGVTIVKEGKEPGQGIGYLDDGTMIVVDGGRSRMDETLTVVVTSVLQTAAGRMIFARIKP